MHFDSAFSKEGNGSKIILMSPRGKDYKLTFILNFECTNNVVEYKALLLGLNMASKYGIKYIKVLGDS